MFSAGADRERRSAAEILGQSKKGKPKECWLWTGRIYMGCGVIQVERVKEAIVSTAFATRPAIASTGAMLLSGQEAAGESRL